MYQKQFKPYSTASLVTVLYAREDAPNTEPNPNTNSNTPNTNADGAAEAAAREAEIQKRINEAVAKQVATTVEGLKKKNEELLGQNKTFKDRIKEFDGLDSNELKALKDRIDNDEDTKLWNEGKKDAVIDKYTERLRQRHQAELEQIRKDLEDTRSVANNYRTHVLDNQIRSVTNGLHPGAVEDALLHARQIFQLDAKGNAVKLGADGNPEVGADGQPFTPAQWIEQQKPLKPHWFPMGTTGSGGSGARSENGTGKTIKRSDFERLSPLEQGAAVRGGSKIID